jgi:hypothetical protein
LADILLLAGERTFGSLLVILSLPPALPIPTPGYSTPFGVLISLLAIQLISRDKTPSLSEKNAEPSSSTHHSARFSESWTALVKKN